MGRGFECDNGWFFLIDTLCKKIQFHIDYQNESVDKGYEWAIKLGKIPQVIFKQVKEKMSGCRIYYDGGDEYIQGLVDQSEELSYNICEVCGIMDNTVGHNKSGWIQTTCKKHVKHDKEFVTNCDDKLKEIFKQMNNEK